MLNNMKRKLETLILKTLYGLYIFPFYIINFLFRINEADLLFGVVAFFRFITTVCLGITFWVYQGTKDVNMFLFTILLILHLLSIVSTVIDGATLAAFEDSKEKYEELLPVKSEYYLVDYNTKKRT